MNKKTVHCGACGKIGHNRRSCVNGKKKTETVKLPPRPLSKLGNEKNATQIISPPPLSTKKRAKTNPGISLHGLASMLAPSAPPAADAVAAGEEKKVWEVDMRNEDGTYRVRFTYGGDNELRIPLQRDLEKFVAAKSALVRVWFNKEGEVHRIGGPAVEGVGLQWFRNGKPHRLDGPSKITPFGKYEGGVVETKQWAVNGVIAENENRCYEIMETNVGLEKLKKYIYDKDFVVANLSGFKLVKEHPSELDQNTLYHLFTNPIFDNDTVELVKKCRNFNPAWDIVRKIQNS